MKSVRDDGTFGTNELGASEKGTNSTIVPLSPLGGALMGDACDHLGQVYGYKNLFAIDGSLLPGSAATVNPAFTIAANAERIMETLVRTL
jgi:cholesterol oxidase